MTPEQREAKIIRLKAAIATDRLLLLKAVDRADRGLAHGLVDGLIDAGRRLEGLIRES